jgi:hypothetical protein
MPTPSKEPTLLATTAASVQPRRQPANPIPHLIGGLHRFKLAPDIAGTVASMTEDDLEGTE